MTTTPTLTTREIKNTATGIDINVPTVKEKVGRLLTDEEFQVIVITNNPVFKQESAKSTDCVQFMVPKRYNQFEALHKALGEKYPATVLPVLPKKLLMLKDSTLSERRNAFDKLMKAIAVNPKICFSSIVLAFLGLTKEQIKKAEVPCAQKSEEIDGDNKNKLTKEPNDRSQLEEVNLFADVEDQDDDLELFGSEKATSMSSKVNNTRNEDEPPKQDDLIALMREADPKPEKPKIKGKFIFRPLCSTLSQTEPWFI
ncbi:HCLS1-binding protein 3-like isoform X2 [Anneissia japonica]|uniref:HCLS1-binding protein 3-like isoform X2 n=1 Tax=Anneissia japonica TaxID=1529436 RepID=UPI00142598BC|nr:HCLS1-binding protein 3-like isoform X2 [Anneissia japonica]